MAGSRIYVYVAYGEDDDRVFVKTVNYDGESTWPFEYCRYNNSRLLSVARYPGNRSKSTHD